LIDYIKYELEKPNIIKFEHNPFLEFETKVSTRTGELGTYSHAYYKSLEFKIFEPTVANPTGRITVEGSLHKYWNNGGHNFNDFNNLDIDEVLNDLSEKFGIQPTECNLKQLEIGLNLFPPFPTETILRCCLMHKTDLFKWIYTKDEGNYIQVKHGHYYIKIYDKQKHYVNKGFTVPNEIMRFEIKYKREQIANTLKKKGVIKLQDVLDFGLHNFKPMLLKEWKNVLFYDFTTLENTRYKDRYSNPNFWVNLKAQNLKYHRNILNKITNSNPENLKKKISDLISEKVDFLNVQTNRIKPLNIPLIQVVNRNGFKGSNSRVCKVTGLNIEMQKEDSFLLSHEGLNYYYRTDRKVFNEVKRKYLSKTWYKAPKSKKIKEIAHNIRNTINNQRLKQTKLYPEHQTKLFSIQEAV
jgi:hypothetical protein